MKYVVASLLALVILFIYAVFSVAVGWRHGGGTLVQASVWLIIAAVWGWTVNQWEAIYGRVRRDRSTGVGSLGLDEDSRFTITLCVIIIVGLGLFYSYRSKSRPSRGVPAAELVRKLDSFARRKYPGTVTMRNDANGAIYNIDIDKTAEARRQGGTYLNVDAIRLYNYLMTHPELHIYHSKGDKWVGEDE